MAGLKTDPFKTSHAQSRDLCLQRITQTKTLLLDFLLRNFQRFNQSHLKVIKTKVYRQNLENFVPLLSG